MTVPFFNPAFLENIVQNLDNDALIEAVACRLDKDPQFYIETCKSRRLQVALDEAERHINMAELEEIAKQAKDRQAA